MKWPKKITIYFTIMSCLLHTVAVYGTDTSDLTEAANNNERAEIIALAKELGKSFEDPSRKAVELDHFHLLSQTFNNSEQDNVAALIDAIQKADPDGENVEDFINDDLPLKRHYNNDLIIEVVNSENQAIKTLKQKDFNESYSPKFNESLDLPEGSKFRILDAKGNLLHTFHRDMSAVGFYGPYLVFLESDSFDKSREVQPLRFINLDYFKATIGNANLPIFTIPLNMKNSGGLHISNGKLLINKTTLTGDAIKVLSDVYQVYFNISVSLLDPRTQIRAEGLLKELSYYFGKNLELQDEAIKSQLYSALKNDSGLEELIKDMESGAKRTSQVSKMELESKKELINALEEGDREKILKLAETQSAFKDSIMQTNRSVQASRLFMSRIYMLMSSMAQPQSLGSTKIIKSMVLFVEGTLKNDKVLRDYSKLSITKHPYFKYVKFGSFAVAAASIGSLLPAPYTFHLYQLIDLSSMLFEQVHGHIINANYGLAFGDLYLKATKVAFSGIGAVVDYFGEAVISKFFVGLTATITIPFMVFGVPHFIVNGILASKEMSKNWKSVRAQGLGRLQSFKKTFIDYNQKAKHDYDELTALAEKEISRIDRSNLTDVELDELRDIIKSKQSKNGLFKLEEIKKSLSMLRQKSGNIFKNIAISIGYESVIIGRGAMAIYAVGEYISGNFLKDSVPENRRMTTFAKALSNFALSYGSLTNTFKFLATTWNYVFIARSFALKPSTWYMALVYPQFLDRAIRSNSGIVHNPSIWNGGKTTLKGILLSKLSRGQAALVERIELQAWEKAIIPLEKIVYQTAMNKALAALIRKIDDPKKLQELFDSTQLPSNRETKVSLMAGGRPTAGISGVTDEKLKRLSGEDLSFFRAYFTKSYDDTMTALVSEMTISNLSQSSQTEIENIKKMNDIELKRLSAKNPQALTTLNELLNNPSKGSEYKTLVSNKMDEMIAQNNIHKFAKDVSTKIGFFFERRKVNYHHNLLKIVDPTNPQLRRFVTAENMLKKSTAVARAVRSEVASLLVDKPLSLLTLLTLYAGVTEGIMKPFYPEAMFGPDSFFYMSRYLILNGFITGTVISIMANTWMKVQTDSRLDDAGEFDKVPTVEWRKKGFWRYYFKSLFNPSNKWAANQMFYTKLVWANIPAVFVMTLATNMLTLGRFDLTAFLTMYIFVFSTPFMGIGLKIEQAFELSSSWVRSQIPKKYRAHPEAQDYIQREIQKKKLMFNFFNQIYETLTGSINGLFENMNTAEYGTRSFARLIFFGYTPTELAALGLRQVGDTLGFIPGVASFTDFCENILTNNDTSLTKIKN